MNISHGFLTEEEIPMFSITVELNIDESEVEVKEVVVYRGGLNSGKHRSEEKVVYYHGVEIGSYSYQPGYWWMGFGSLVVPDVIRERATKIKFSNFLPIHCFAPCGLQFLRGDYTWGKAKGSLTTSDWGNEVRAEINVETDSKDGVEDARDLYRYFMHEPYREFAERREEMRREFNKLNPGHSIMPYSFAGRIVRV